MRPAYRSRSTTNAIILIAVYSISLSSESRGERVGYSFAGVFKQPISALTEYNIFGVKFPLDAPFTGTFSYDTTADFIVRYEGSKDFKQRIQGGFSFNVSNTITGPLNLVANVYTVRVTNDHLPSGAPVASDLVSVVFNTLEDASLPSILKNGSPYTKKPVLIDAPLSWDWSVFNSPDDPQLHSDLPHENFFPFQGSMAAQGAATFEIRDFLRIVPSAGDYNIDGKTDGLDCLEWRKAFGQTSPDFSYADGDHDGIIDAGDYVIWRSALAASAAGAGSSAVPESSAIALTVLSMFVLSINHGRRSLCR
jgi:hypothetical protein